MSTAPQVDAPRSGRGETAMVPPAKPTSYYGRPVLKRPVWEPLIAAYLFTGGLAGGSMSIAASARLAGRDRLARRAGLLAMAGLTVSPVLLIADLGRPARFLNMLRVFKPTSPMSVGTWLLTAGGGATGTATLCTLLDVLPRLRTAAEAAAGLLGPGVATYTATLLADTAVPAWHEAGNELPFTFAASAAASAAAGLLLVGPEEDRDALRRLCAGAAAAEITSSVVMERRLGGAARPYRHGRSHRFGTAARVLSTAGAATVALCGPRRAPRIAGALAVLAGAVSLRWSVFEAGRQGADDPTLVVGPQRARLAAAR